jgi:GNAT superfamily N-acetyltransferase
MNQLNHLIYQDFVIRPWQPVDRQAIAAVIGTVLIEYGLGWEPELADRDVLEVEKYYLESGGEFWSVEQQGQIVGSAGYYPIERGYQAVEIRKMYLLPTTRGQGLGRFLLASRIGEIDQTKKISRNLGRDRNSIGRGRAAVRKQWLFTSNWGRNSPVRSSVC